MKVTQIESGSVHKQCSKIISLNYVNRAFFPSDIHPLQSWGLFWGFCWRVGFFKKNSVHALYQSILWWNWKKEGRKKKKKKEHSTVSLCKSGIKHTNNSSLQRPVIHFLVQSRKLGNLWACSPDPMPATRAHTQVCVHSHTQSKRQSHSLWKWWVTLPRAQRNACMGFPSGYETTISFPGRYLSIVSIIFPHDGSKGT